jgi:hypothetical protein
MTDHSDYNAVVTSRAIETGDELANDLLMELQDSIPQGVPNDTGHRRRATDPVTEDLEVDSLDMLLQESVGAKEAEEQHKLDLAARKRGFAGMSKEEVDFCNSRMHAFEMARVWKPDYAIEVWERFCCAGCGQTRTVFSRYMEHHKSRANPTSSRWITVKETQLPEPTPVKEDREVPVCPKCSPWDLDPRAMSDLAEVLK